MKSIKLLHTDLTVSPLCLGTVNYGTSTREEAALRQMSRYVELGGNFMDTALIYGVAVGQGVSERIVGRWLRETGLRDRVVLSTKGAHPDIKHMDVPRVKPEMILDDIEQSLQNLGVDCIDLYFLHRDDPAMPVSEILGALEGAVRAGKIRYYGCSNWTLPRIREANALSGVKGFVCNQLMWSLADVRREGIQDPTLVAMDAETRAYQLETGLNAMAYSSVAKGYFMHRMAGDDYRPSRHALYDTPENDLILEAMREQGLTPLQATLQYLTRQPFPSVPIASFSSDWQLEDAVRACEAAPNDAALQHLGALKRYLS